MAARQDLVRWTGSLAGRPLGEFTTGSAVPLTAEDSKGARGAGQQERSRGGRKTIGNITVGRDFDERYDIEDEADRHRGKPDVFVLTRQRLDVDHNDKGPAKTYVGTLVRYEVGEADADGDDADTVEYEMSVSSAR